MKARVMVAAWVGLAIAAPPLAQAVEFAPEAGGPPLIQTPSGFVGVPGPHAWSPEHFQAFPPPPPAQPSVQACTNCPSPAQMQPASNPAAPAR